jgi:mRNA-degrading endonuclease RelE of RelBE toxin-antitoxin system
MPWQLELARSAEKALIRIPIRDQKHIIAALRGMTLDPFGGDIVRLHNQPGSWRRRVGSWRVFFDLYPHRLLIVITAIKRRTSSTY